MTKFRNPLSTLVGVNHSDRGIETTTADSSLLPPSGAAEKKNQLAQSFTVHQRVSPKKVTSFARRMRHK